MWIIYVVGGLLVIGILVLGFMAWQYHREYWHYADIPHEPPIKLWTIVKMLATQTNLTEEQRVKRYNQLYKKFKGTGPFCGFYALLQPRALVLERELINQIMIKDFSNFNDRGLYSHRQQDPLSGDLYGLRGNSWKEMRLKLDPIFEKDKMSWLYDTMYEEAKKSIEFFDAALEHQENPTVHIQKLMQHCVLSSLASCVFGLHESELDEKFAEFEAMTDELLHDSRHGYYMNLLMIRFPNLCRYLRFENTTKQVSDYFMSLLANVVEEREKSAERHRDYLQLLLDIRTQELSTHETTSDNRNVKAHLDQELAAHAVVFLKAGYQQTAKTLAYVLYELALHTDIQEHVRAELFEIIANNNEVLDYSCLESLKFMDQVILETLRRHPITPYIMRRTLSDYKLSDNPKYKLSRECFIIIPTHAIHNDPTYYPEPESFRPERFGNLHIRTRGICQWFGFGEGSRNCIGIHFAQLQIRLILTLLLRKFEFSVSTKEPLISLEDGIALQVMPLQKESRDDNKLNLEQ